MVQRKLTRERRKAKVCKVFELKIDKSHLSNKIFDHLNAIFREAKWYYNHCLSHKNLNDVDDKVKAVPVKVGEVYETREFTALKSQMKQAIRTRLFGSLMSLSALKKSGRRVGRLKFKSFVHSVPLKQFKLTYDIDAKHSTVRIQGVKNKLKVRGLEQITPDMEIANATLIKRDDDFYLHITTFSDKVERNIPEQSIGIDFGCQTQLTLSDGTKIEFQVPESDRLRRLSRKIDKKVNGKIGRHRGSNNRRKLQSKRRKEYNHLVSKKSDIRSKVVSAITNSYKYVCFQNESIHAWSTSGHGKKIQHSGIGGILSDLKNKSHTPIEVSKFFPSTQLCPQCGSKKKMHVSERVYECTCGFKDDRDIKSARCIEEEGLRVGKSDKIVPLYIVPTEHREVKPKEKSSSACFDVLMKVNGIKVRKMTSLS